MSVKQSLQSMIAIAKNAARGSITGIKSEADPLPQYSTDSEAAVTLSKINAAVAAGSVAEKSTFQASVSGGVSEVAFDTSVPLGASASVMPQQTIGSVLTFTPAADPVLFGSCHMRLIADGTNAPVFAGFYEFGSSAGWNNTSGIINHVDFWWDGVTYWYVVQQAANSVPVVVPSMTSATIASASPTHIVVVFAANLNTSSVPAASSFTVSNSGGADSVTAVSVSGNTVTLTKSRTTVGSDTVLLSYSAPASGALVSADGIAVGSFAGQSVTNQLASAFVRLATLTAYTESGNSTSGYSYTATGGNLGTALASNSNVSLPGDGYIQAKVAGTVAATGLFFLDDANDTTNYVSNILGIQTNGAGSAYLIVGSGSANNAANGTAVLAALNDLIRIERSGTVGYVKVSKDSGVSWTLLYTLTGMTTATLYPKFNGGPTGIVWGPVSGFGVA